LSIPSNILEEMRRIGVETPRASDGGGTVRRRVEEHAKRIGVPVPLVGAVLGQESGWSHTYPSGKVKTSPKGARGLFQVMPETGRQLGFDDLDDLDQNIQAGLTYLKQGLDESGGDSTYALTRYHGGPGAAATYKRTGRVPKISDGLITTDRYVANIQRSAGDGTGGGGAAQIPANVRTELERITGAQAQTETPRPSPSAVPEHLRGELERINGQPVATPAPSGIASLSAGVSAQPATAARERQAAGGGAAGSDLPGYGKRLTREAILTKYNQVKNTYPHMTLQQVVDAAIEQGYKVER
jgi:Transglycosylase SLT domain